ncbi:MAG: CRISPR-associated protein Cas5 [Halanaerobiales bacterium]|nr:CRISPR-associated protein Cas5 [Halanaerobiales bacterium]
MEVLSFHLKGKMGHFRRYYSNSSALTYTIPPRTTVAGIIAGILGMERDSYYDLFNLSNCNIAIGLGEPVRKIIQKMNLLMVKSVNDLNGSKENHSQCATEFVIPENIRSGEIDYKIWISHNDPNIMNKLRQSLEIQGGCYQSTGISVALGSAQNLGWIKYEGCSTGEVKKNDNAVFIDSVIPIDKIQELSIFGNENAQLIKEELCLEFDMSRKITKDGKKFMIINKTGLPIKAVVHEYISINNENIIWMN